MQYVNAADWFAFEKAFPQAAAFLNNAALRGEYAHLAKLNSDGRCNAWQLNRLTELARHFSSNEKIEKGEWQ